MKSKKLKNFPDIDKETIEALKSTFDELRNKLFDVFLSEFKKDSERGRLTIMICMRNVSRIFKLLRKTLHSLNRG